MQVVYFSTCSIYIQYAQKIPLNFGGQWSCHHGGWVQRPYRCRRRRPNPSVNSTRPPAREKDSEMLELLLHPGHELHLSPAGDHSLRFGFGLGSSYSFAKRPSESCRSVHDPAAPGNSVRTPPGTELLIQNAKIPTKIIVLYCIVFWINIMMLDYGFEFQSDFFFCRFYVLIKQSLAYSLCILWGRCQYWHFSRKRTYVSCLSSFFQIMCTLRTRQVTPTLSAE